MRDSPEPLELLKRGTIPVRTACGWARQWITRWAARRQQTEEKDEKGVYMQACMLRWKKKPSALPKAKKYCPEPPLPSNIMWFWRYPGRAKPLLVLTIRTILPFLVLTAKKANPISRHLSHSPSRSPSTPLNDSNMRILTPPHYVLVRVDIQQRVIKTEYVARIKEMQWRTRGALNATREERSRKVRKQRRGEVRGRNRISSIDFQETFGKCSLFIVSIRTFFF